MTCLLAIPTTHTKYHRHQTYLSSIPKTFASLQTSPKANNPCNKITKLHKILSSTAHLHVKYVPSVPLTSSRFPRLTPSNVYCMNLHVRDRGGRAVGANWDLGEPVGWLFKGHRMSRRSRVKVEETSDWISVHLGVVDVIGLRM